MRRRPAQAQFMLRKDPMSSLNFIGGEKGGVGKSVTARLLA
jgi:hypothetical protein